VPHRREAARAPHRIARPTKTGGSAGRCDLRAPMICLLRYAGMHDPRYGEHHERVEDSPHTATGRSTRRGARGNLPGQRPNRDQSPTPKTRTQRRRKESRTRSPSPRRQALNRTTFTVFLSSSGHLRFTTKALTTGAMIVVAIRKSASRRSAGHARLGARIGDVRDRRRTMPSSHDGKRRDATAQPPTKQGEKEVPARRRG
jgi:hypothetical protein